MLFKFLTVCSLFLGLSAYADATGELPDDINPDYLSLERKNPVDNIVENNSVRGFTEGSNFNKSGDPVDRTTWSGSSRDLWDCEPDHGSSYYNGI